MGKFKKKPVEIEAEKISDLIDDAQKNFNSLPDWVKAEYDKGNLLFSKNHVVVQTLEGSMVGQKNDFLIQGVKGEIYPCKPDIFAETYEAV